MNFLIQLVLGALAGWVASLIMKSRSSLLWNILVGAVGGLLGGWLAKAIGIGAQNRLGSFLVAVAGACVLIFLVRLIRGKR